jgi:heme/copper-type cytochrome/quinol oxidase subunit 3
MAITLHDPIGIEPATEAPLGRRNVLLVGTALAVAGLAVLVGAVLAGYLQARDVAKASNQVWPPEETTIPNVALFTIFVGLALSSFTAHWSLAAIRMDDRRQAYLAFGSTIGFGALFVNGMTFSWARLGLEAGSSAYANHVYAVTAVHTLIVVAATLVFVVVGFRVFGGQFGPRNREPVAAAVLFWHFAVLSGLVVWWTLWFLEGGPG